MLFLGIGAVGNVTVGKLEKGCRWMGGHGVTLPYLLLIAPLRVAYIVSIYGPDGGNATISLSVFLETWKRPYLIPSLLLKMLGCHGVLRPMSWRLLPCFLQVSVKPTNGM